MHAEKIVRIGPRGDGTVSSEATEFPEFLDRILVRVLGVDMFARRKLERSALNCNGLIGVAHNVHFDPPFIGNIDCAVAEVGQIEVTAQFAARAAELKADAIAGIEARGFIFAPAVAAQMGLPFIPVRKEGKLPYDCVTHSYDLEYGSDTLQIHVDALSQGQRVVIVDDLIATGGTMCAAAKLITRSGGHVVETATIIDLPELAGSDKIREAGFGVFAVCSFTEDE